MLRTTAINTFNTVTTPEPLPQVRLCWPLCTFINYIYVGLLYLLSADVRTLDAFHRSVWNSCLVNVIVVVQAPTERITAARRSQLLLLDKSQLPPTDPRDAMQQVTPIVSYTKMDGQHDKVATGRTKLTMLETVNVPWWNFQVLSWRQSSRRKCPYFGDTRISLAHIEGSFCSKTCSVRSIISTEHRPVKDGRRYGHFVQV